MSLRFFTEKPVAEPRLAPGFLRHIAAVVYDLFLLLAVWFVATALLLPLNGGQAFRADQLFYPLYLFLVSWGFYVWFWTHGGQTLGLRSWKLRLTTFEGSRVNWRQASLRFIAAGLSWACLGLGFAWCLWDKQGLCWHDYVSATRLQRVLQ